MSFQCMSSKSIVYVNWCIYALLDLDQFTGREIFMNYILYDWNWWQIRCIMSMAFN